MTEIRVAGIDLGDKYSYVCVLGIDGEIEEETRLSTTERGMRGWLEKQQNILVVVEVGMHSRWVSELVMACGLPVLVANARHVRLIYGRNTKTDQTDAEILARLGRFDPQLLHPVMHRNREAQRDLVVIKSRNALVEVRSKLINHVRGTVKSFGYRLPACAGESFHRERIRMQIPEELKSSLMPVMEEIAALAARILRLDEQIKEMAESKYPEVQRLQQVNGVGPVTSMTFVLTLESPSRFQHNRSVGPFLGLVPRLDQSGSQDPDLRITRAGNPYLRKLLVQAAHHILGPFGSASDLRAWGFKLAAHGGKRGKKRAVIAVARRLAVLLMALWRNGEDYVPIRGRSDMSRKENQLEVA